MSGEITILPIEPSSQQLEEIASEAREQGYAFVDRLVCEAQSGKNLFNKDGECFCGAFIDGILVGCGGINIDPYADQGVGRVRHVFVLSRYRRKGVASELMQHLLRQSKLSFGIVRLRTSNEGADKFYEALGFRRTIEEAATHIFEL